MARVYLAQVDDRTEATLGSALEAARAWLGCPPRSGDVRAVTTARWGGLRRRAQEPLLRALLGRGDRVGFLGRRGEQLRYQLSVGDDRAHDRLEARAALYRVDGLLLAPTLSADAMADGVGGAVVFAARRLLAAPPDRLEPDERAEVLAELLELATPDLVVADGTSVRLGLAPDSAPRALGLVLVADDALAADAVWARILGLDPTRIPWMVRAAARGLGAIEDIELGGVDPQLFARRVQGAPAPWWDLGQVAARWADELGGDFPLRVLGPTRTCGGERLLTWVSALREQPLLREQLPGTPRVAAICGAVDALPDEDRILTIGPAATRSVLEHPSVRRSIAVPRWLTRTWAASGQTWHLWLDDGRKVKVAAIDDAAPSHRAIRRGFQRLGWRLSGAPAAGGDGPSWIERVRRPLPTPVVHARRIQRLQELPWRQRWQPRRLQLRAPEEAEHGA